MGEISVKVSKREKADQEALPVHHLPLASAELPSLHIYRFKKSDYLAPTDPLLPVTPLPTDMPHRHTYYELMVFEQGEGFHEIDFQSYALDSPAVHFLAPGDVHLLTPRAECKGYILAFSEEFGRFYGANVPTLTTVPFFQKTQRIAVLPLSADEQRYLFRLLENMVEDYLSNDPEAPVRLAAYLGAFLHKCLQLAPLPEKLPNAPRRDLVGRFQELVEQKFLEFHEVQYYAGELAVTPDYLSKITKKVLGCTAGDYILDKLLLEAKRLLVFTELTNKEISYQIHIDDPSYFGRIFKRKTGLTPNEYRISVRKSTTY